VNGMMCSSHFCPCHWKDSAAVRAKYPTNSSLSTFNRTWGDNNKYFSDLKIAIPGSTPWSAYTYNQYLYNVGNITSAW